MPPPEHEHGEADDRMHRHEAECGDPGPVAMALTTMARSVRSPNRPASTTPAAEARPNTSSMAPMPPGTCVAGASTSRVMKVYVP